MDFYDVISRCGPETIETRRVFEPSFAELLIRNEHVETWYTECKDLLGEPVKAADAPASDHSTAIAKDYGGARTGQTLYSHEAYGLRMVVIFWPWAKGPYTTVRMGITDLAAEQEKAADQSKPAAYSSNVPDTPTGGGSQVTSIGAHFSRGIGTKPSAGDDAVSRRVAALEGEIQQLKEQLSEMAAKLDS